MISFYKASSEISIKAKHLSTAVSISYLD